MLAKAFGARVIAVDVEPSRLEMAAAASAPTTSSTRREQDPVAAVRDLTRHGEGADKSIECSANAAVRRQAVQACDRGEPPAWSGCSATSSWTARNSSICGRPSWDRSPSARTSRRSARSFVAERGLDVESLFTNEFRAGRGRTGLRVVRSTPDRQGRLRLRLTDVAGVRRKESSDHNPAERSLR